MCGQLGFSGEEPFDIDKIKTLILWNSLERGEDATGLYSPINGLKKCLLKGSDFVVNKNYNLDPDTIFMAHVRAKTVGANIVENAHPFNRGEWYLQHNGTLKNYKDLIEKYDLDISNFNVDSDVICGAIEKAGDLSVLKYIDGPAALIIQNKNNPNELTVFRNNERPLFRGMIGKNMYISSIKESLQLINCTNVKEFKIDTIYTIINGSITKSQKVKSEPYSKPEPEFVRYGNSLNNNEPLMGFVDCWLRASTTIHAYNAPFELTTNKYYLIKDCKNNFFDVYDRTTGKTDKHWSGNFRKEDAIIKNSLCKAIYTITDNENKDKTILITAGDILNVIQVNEKEKLVQLQDPKTYKVLCWAQLSYFVKLTAQQEEDYNKLLYGSGDYSLAYDTYGDYDSYETDDFNNSFKQPKNENPNQLKLIEDDSDEDLLPDNFEIHFTKTDELLETLKELIFKEQIDNPKINLIMNELMANNFNISYEYMEMFGGAYAN